MEFEYGCSVEKYAEKDIRWILIVMKVKQQGQVVIRISLE